MRGRGPGTETNAITERNNPTFQEETFLNIPDRQRRACSTCPVELHDNNFCLYDNVSEVVTLHSRRKLDGTNAQQTVRVPFVTPIDTSIRPLSSQISANSRLLTTDALMFPSHMPSPASHRWPTLGEPFVCHLHVHLPPMIAFGTVQRRFQVTCHFGPERQSMDFHASTYA